MKMKWTTGLCLLAVMAVLVTGGMVLADAPKASTFAPAEDLAGQVECYLDRLEGSVESEDDYEDSKSKIAKDSNTMIVIALTLGLHDTDNPYKAAAPAMVKAAQELAGAKDYASAKKAVEAVKKASTSKGGGALKWEKAASLDELMEAVPLINTKLKRATKGSRFKKKAKDSAGYSAVLAAIAQGTMANSGDTEKPSEADKWVKYCTQMRDAAAKVNSGIRAQDEDATKAAMECLGQACDDCHAVFHNEDH